MRRVYVWQFSGGPIWGTQMRRSESGHRQGEDALLYIIVKIELTLIMAARGTETTVENDMSMMPKIAIGLPIALMMAGVVGAQPASVPDHAPGHAQTAGTDSEFAAFDADKSGKLDSSEFSTWYQAKAEQQRGDAGQAASPEDVSKMATQAFSRADADRDQAVTREELTRFLAG